MNQETYPIIQNISEYRQQLNTMLDSERLEQASKDQLLEILTAVRGALCEVVPLCKQLPVPTR